MSTKTTLKRILEATVQTAERKTLDKKTNQAIVNKSVIKSSDRKNTHTKKITNNKMTVVDAYHLITTFNINGLNFPVKRHELAEWVED